MKFGFPVVSRNAPPI